MSETLFVLLGCAGGILLVGLALAYIVTSAARKKSQCPECSHKVLPKQAYYLDPQNGGKIPAERDISFGLVSSLGKILIGFVLFVFVLLMIIPTIGNDSCNFEGVVIQCTSYSGGYRMETTINLIYAFLAVIGGLALILSSTGQFQRTLASRNKQLTLEFECPAKHTWTEKYPAAEV